MARIVQKFGGSSVADMDKVAHVARVIAKAFDEGHEVATVVSAMGKTTDALVKLAHEAKPNPSGREYDMLLATGEMVSASLLAMTLQGMGYQAIALNGAQAGIRTEDEFNKARILYIDPEPLLTLFGQRVIPIITGFQGMNSRHEFTTFGRGGSDTTAVALAGAVKADSCDIYTDVRGVFSTDPRVEPNAIKLPEIATIEMLELARLGAKVLHPRSVEAARRSDVKLRVRSTFELDDEGTWVVNEEALEIQRRVAGVACDTNQVRIAVTDVPDEPGMAARLFDRLAQLNVSVDMIIQSLGHDNTTNDIAFTISTTDLPILETHLTELQALVKAKQVLVDNEIAKVSIVGVGMVDQPGVASDMFMALSDAGINLKMISTSEIKISCLVEKDKSTEAIRAIHAKFFDEADKPQVALVDGKVGY